MNLLINHHGVTTVRRLLRYHNLLKFTKIYTIS